MELSKVNALVRVELDDPETDRPQWWQEWDGEGVTTVLAPGADPEWPHPCDVGGYGFADWEDHFQRQLPEEIAAEILDLQAGAGLPGRILVPDPPRAFIGGECRQCGHEPLYDRPGYRRVRWMDRSGVEPVERSETIKCFHVSHLWRRTCPADIRAYEDRCRRVGEEHEAVLLGLSIDALRAEVAEANEGIEAAHRAANGKWTEALHDRKDAESARYDRALAELRRREGASG